MTGDDCRPSLATDLPFAIAPVAIAPFAIAPVAIALFGLALALTPIAGCRSPTSASPLDATAQSVDSSATDPSSSDFAQPCKAARTCARNVVLACSGGLPADTVETCAESCSWGRCVSADCAATERSDAARGCLFYGVRPISIDSDIDRPTLLLFASDSNWDANIAVETRSLDGTWLPVARATLPAHGRQAVSFTNLPPSIRHAGATPRAAFRVVTEHPALVVQLSGDNFDRKSQSTGGTVLRPIQALGLGHFALTYPQKPSDHVRLTPGSWSGAGAVVVVATQDDTAVTLNPKADVVASGVEGQTSSPAGTPVSFRLDEGDVFQMLSAHDDGDLTGTFIGSTRPVAAFSGNVYSTYGAPVTGFNGGDMTFEQLPPEESWNYESVGAWLSPQANCDSFGQPGSGRWSVISAQDDTDITIETAPGASIVGVTSTFRLGRGESRSFVVQGPATPSPGGTDSNFGDFLVHASLGKRLLLAQWLDCEPALSWGIDTRHGQGDLNLNLPPGFDHEIALVRERKVNTVIVNAGYHLEPRFQPVGTAGRFEVARITSADLAPCGDAKDNCAVILGSGVLGVTWRGMDVVCSYAATVPPRNTACALRGATCPN